MSENGKDKGKLVLGLMLMMAIGAVAMLLGFLGFVLCLGLKLAAVGLYAWWYFARLPYSS